MEINLDRFLAITALLAAAGVTACSVENVDTTKDGGTGGSAGTAGTAGTGGTAGTDGAAGTGGTAGTGGAAGTGGFGIAGSSGADAAAPDAVALDGTASDVSADQAAGDAAQPDAVGADQASPDASPDQVAPDAAACLGDEPVADAAADAGDPSDPCWELPTPSPSSETVCTLGQDMCIQFAGRVKPAVFAKMLACLSTVTEGDAGTCDAFDAASEKCIDDTFALACPPAGTSCDAIAAACPARNEEYPDAGPVATDGGAPAFPGITVADCKTALAPLIASEQAVTVNCFNTAWADPLMGCESIFTACVLSGSVE